MSGFLAVLAALALTSCASGVTPASVPVSATPSPGSPASHGVAAASQIGDPVTASEPPLQTAGPAAPGQLAQVIVDELVVRSAPGTGADSELHAGYLRQGQRIWLYEGPVSASGYEWYRVVSEVPPLIDGESRVYEGWVASGSRHGEPWLRALAPTCPADVDLAILSGMTTAERIQCLSGRSLVVEGWVPPVWVSGGCDGGEPGWLTCWLATTPLVNVEPPAAAVAEPNGAPGWDEGAARISLHAPPDHGPLLLSPGDHVAVAGHVDDDAAVECHMPNYGEDELPVGPDPVLVYACQGAFVVDELTRLD